jgi:hypothetical protein
MDPWKATSAAEFTTWSMRSWRASFELARDVRKPVMVDADERHATRIGAQERLAETPSRAGQQADRSISSI